MSASHHPPFKKKDVGFRDAVIYLSVIDHLLQAKDNRGALITQDEIFQHPVIAEFAKSQGVQLEIFATVNEVDDALAETLEDALRKAWERDNQKVENALKGKVPEIEKFVTENLLIPEWELSWVVVGKPLGITSIKVLNIKGVRTPPLVDRKAADPLQISFEMDVALAMVLEVYPSAAPQPLRVGEVRDPLLSEIFRTGTPLLSREEKVLERTLEVEGTVTPTDDSYEKIQFTAVRFKSSGLGLARGLIK